MSKKKFNILEQHADKIILAVAALLALYILWAMVIVSPNTQKVDNKKLSPGQIDPYIEKQADKIKEKFEDPATAKIYDKSKSAEFEQKLVCSISDVPTDIYFPLPGSGRNIDTTEQRQYALPVIPPLEKVISSAYRAAARMPTEDVTPEMTYKNIQGETADLDLVSVSARINIKALVQNFRLSFMSERLTSKWRDPSLAEPVFARIELQRRYANPDGSWSDWQIVPPVRINPYKQFQSELPLDTQQLTYGTADLFISQYKNNMDVILNILQPVWYDFMVARTQWLPPEYYTRYIQELDRQDQQRLRELRETRMRERTTASGRPGRAPAPTRSRETQSSRLENPEMSMFMPTTPVRPVKPETKPEDILKEFDKEVLTDKTELSTLSDPVLIWASDDTVKPDGKYQYRIRYGVFNPIAGNDWCLPDYKQYQNQIVLWSPFAELPDVVHIPKMLHIFPLELLADASGLKVEVCKYNLGSWRNQDFQVAPGQTIGKAVQSSSTPPTAMDALMMVPGFEPGATATPEQPETIDYTTDWVMVDIVQTADWAQKTGVTRRSYPEMLYISQNQTLLTIPVGKQNWSKEMRKDYDDIKQAQQQELQPIETRPTNMPMEMMGPPGFPGMFY